MIHSEKALEKNGSSNQEIVNPDDEEPAVEREAAVEVEASEVAPDTVVAVDPNLLEAKSGENDEQPVENGGALESDAKEEDGQASPLVDGEEVILATGVADDEGGGGGNNDNIRLGAELAGPKGVELDVEEMPDDD